MKLEPRVKEGLLSSLQEILSGVKWAPEESWLEGEVNERESRRGTEPVIFRSVCDCDGESGERCLLTLFLKADLLGQHYNTTARLQHQAEKWAKRELKWEGCGICGSELTVDVRLFRMDNRLMEGLGEKREERDEVFD